MAKPDLKTAQGAEAGTNTASLRFEKISIQDRSNMIGGEARVDIGAFEFVHPTVDSNGDGMTDAAEVIAGTNPTDAGSRLRLDAGRGHGPTGMLLHWLSVTGRRYRVESCPVFHTGWQTVVSNLAGGGERMEWLRPSDEVLPRFYRLGVSRD